MVYVVERGVVSRISKALKWDIYGHTVAALMLFTTVIGLGSVCQSKHSERHEHQEANPKGRLGEAEDKVTQQTESTDSLGENKKGEALLLGVIRDTQLGGSDSSTNPLTKRVTV